MSAAVPRQRQHQVPEQQRQRQAEGPRVAQQRMEGDPPGEVAHRVHAEQGQGLEQEEVPARPPNTGGDS